MRYSKRITLKNGELCLIRSAVGADAKEVWDNFMLCHKETDNLLSYPDENRFTIGAERDFLTDILENPREAELIAIYDGRVVGTAGLEAVGSRDKVRHRANFGINVEKACWGLGIGRALTEACIECARLAGYEQLELDHVGTNDTAHALYESVGFVEYGRNPKGFKSRYCGWQELVLMRLELE